MSHWSALTIFLTSYLPSVKSLLREREKKRKNGKAKR